MKKTVLYKSTRSDAAPVSCCEALLRGLAPDGGLYVPVSMPSLADLDESGDVLHALDRLAGMDYRELACSVLGLLLTDFTDEELRSCVYGAYDDKFDTPEIAPVVKKDGMYYLELFHGQTIAFKDMALSVLPRLMTAASAKLGRSDEIVILTATSGDTGKAALAAFADVPGTRIVVFYPKYGVSPVQERQMATQRGANVKVIGITGNFDEAQSGVKEIFSDRDLERELKGLGCQFSSANSINIGRLVPQVAYYVWAYTRLVAQGAIRNGQSVNFTVPTGNFGNILAGYYAMRMGLPVRKLVCASNENKVLYDFFVSGTYDRNREFRVTSSPSMDILISSNLERLIYEIAGCDAAVCADLMKSLKEKGRYELTPEMRKRLSCFAAGYASEDDTACEIAGLWRRSGYVIDTHTAVASCVARYYKDQSEDMACGATADVPMIVVSTASPFKFTRSVMSAIDKKYAGEDDFSLVDALSELTGLRIPHAIEDIRTAPVLHDTVCSGEEMRGEVLRFLRR
ncbi:MAG: threonine synthase [Lachnospiraceae bacterium]|nr:threonine synthase [Lachnospiraceae bacterium]